MPRLRPARDGAGIPVEVRLTAVAAELRGGQRLSQYLTVSPEQFLLDIPATARYLVTDGQRVEIELAPGALLVDVHAYLTGSVLGALCHQNGMLPLHASAIRLAGRVTAFAADSGAGKSTLAACLYARGCSVLADDICLLDFPEGLTRPRLIPIAPWLKLYRESAAFVRQPIHEANRTFSDEDKYYMPLEPLDRSAPADAQQASQAAELQYLDRIVFLSRDSLVHAPVLEPVRGVASLARLVSKIYQGYIAEAAGIEPRVFQQCAAALKQASTFALRVPPGLDRIAETVELLEPLLRS